MIMSLFNIITGLFTITVLFNMLTGPFHITGLYYDSLCGWSAYCDNWSVNYDISACGWSV